MIGLGEPGAMLGNAPAARGKLTKWGNAFWRIQWISKSNSLGGKVLNQSNRCDARLAYLTQAGLKPIGIALALIDDGHHCIDCP